MQSVRVLNIKKALNEMGTNTIKRKGSADHGCVSVYAFATTANQELQQCCTQGLQKGGGGGGRRKGDAAREKGGSGIHSFVTPFFE